MGAIILSGNILNNRSMIKRKDPADFTFVTIAGTNDPISSTNDPAHGLDDIRLRFASGLPGVGEGTNGPVVAAGKTGGAVGSPVEVDA